MSNFNPIASRLELDSRGSNLNKVNDLMRGELFHIWKRKNYTREVIEWRDAIVANGGATPTSSTLKTFDTFVKGCKADGIWDLILDCAFFVGLADLNSILVKLKTPTGVARVLTNNNFVSGDYTVTGASAGLKGNGSNKFLNTNTPQSTIAVSNSHISIYYTSLTSGTFGNFIGAENASNSNKLALGRSGSATAWLYADSTGASSITDTTTLDSNGFIGGAKSAVEERLYKNGTTVLTEPSIGDRVATITPIVIFALNRGGTIVGVTDPGMTFYSIGNFLTASQSLSLSNRVNAVMTAFGANVY